MIGIHNYISANGEDLKDAMRKADDLMGKGELIYLGEVQYQEGLSGDLYHYLSSTVIVIGTKEHSRLTVIAPEEDKAKMKEGLEKKLGINFLI